MDPTILVRQKIDQGAELIRTLDSRNFPVTSALWFFDPDDKKWKLIIATPNYDIQGPRSVYEFIQNFVPAVNPEGISLTDITATSPSNKLITILRQVFSAPSGISNISLRGNTINNTYIEAVHIYRLG